MTNTSTHSDLRVGITNRQILKIALPISLAMLVPQINFVTNNIFLSNLGETILGTAGITGVFYLIFALVGNGLNSGLQSLIARRAGENRPEEIGKLFGQSIWMAMFFSAAGILITYIVAPYFLKASLHSPVVQQEAIRFLKIRIWGLPFLYLFQMCNAFLVGTNNSRYLKFGFFTGAVINIFLDYVLINGYLGFPDMGFDGAAVASIIAEFIALAITISIIFYKKMDKRFGLFNFLPFDKKLSSLIFRQSSPLVLQWLLSIVGWMLFFVLIEHYGEMSLAVSNIMRNIFGVAGIFSWAFASTANAMVSNVIGQGKSDQVQYLIKKIMWLSISFSAFICLLINIFPEIFLSVFHLNNEFTGEAIRVMKIVSAGLFCMAIATVWLNAVTGTGNTRVNLIIELAAIAIYCVYIWLVMEVWKLSLAWAWTSEILYWSLLFTFSFLYIRSDKWKGKVF